MISLWLINFIIGIDKEIEWNPDDSVCLKIIILEIVNLLLCIELYWINGNNSVIQFLLYIVIGIYFNIISMIDWYTGYVYGIFNYIVFGLIGAYIYITGNGAIVFIAGFLLFAIFILFCEKIHAFEHGDTQIYMVVYFIIQFINWENNTFELILVTMLVSSISLGIYRILKGKREVMIPFSPFIVSSVYIVLFCYFFITGKEVYATIW